MARKIAELTPNELKFCRLRAQGYDQTQAYRQAFNKPRMMAKSVTEAASRLAAKPQVLATMKDLFASARKSELLSHAEYLDNLKSDYAAAKEVGNWTAAASFARLIGQAIGSLSDTVVLEERMPPEILLARLEGILDANAIEQLRRRLFAKDTFH